MTTAAGGRTGLRLAVFYQPAMASRAVSMIGFPQSRNLVVWQSDVAFLAGELFTFCINKLAALVVGHMVADTAAIGLQRFGVNLMGKGDRRPPQLAKNILVRQDVFRLLCNRNRPGGQTEQS